MNADVDFARLPACPTEVFDTVYSRTGLLRHRRDRINCVVMSRCRYKRGVW